MLSLLTRWEISATSMMREPLLTRLNFASLLHQLEEISEYDGTCCFSEFHQLSAISNTEQTRLAKFPTIDYKSIMNVDNNNSSIGGLASTSASDNTQLNLPPLPLPAQAQKFQNPYEYKCSLLEYHINEAVLINKALKSELQQYKEKIDFEKKLRTVLIDRVSNLNPSS